MDSTMQYKIEKDVPVPPSLTTGRNATYPFVKMEVGDSFSFPKKLMSKVRTAANNFSVRHKKKNEIFKFIVRGNRCWRIE